MRDIKFRAWVKDPESWLVKKWNRMIEDLTSKIIFESVWFWSPDELEYMQFTWLLDKNGKEIYEGDILVDSIWRKTVVEYWEWNCWCCDSIYWFRFWYSENSEQEVIGNKFENPELLSN